MCRFNGGDYENNQIEYDAAVSFDGLHEVDNSRADIAWAVPDFDLSGYTSILPVSLGIEYTEVENRANTAVTRGQRGPYFIDDNARAEFEALVSEIFMEELQKSERFRIVKVLGDRITGSARRI